jgi:hypothetical protein
MWKNRKEGVYNPRNRIRVFYMRQHGEMLLATGVYESFIFTGFGKN